MKAPLVRTIRELAAASHNLARNGNGKGNVVPLVPKLLFGEHHGGTGIDILIRRDMSINQYPSPTTYLMGDSH